MNGPSMIKCQRSMHDFSSKTLSSNMTTRRIRLLVEKNGQVRHLVDFIFNRSTTPGRKKIDQVSDFAFFETSIFFFFTWHRPLQKSNWLTRLIDKLSSLVRVLVQKMNEKIKRICQDHAQRTVQEYLRGIAYNINY